MDERQANAVAARIELDLRIGAALTRLQTLSLQTMGPQLQDMVLSYGWETGFIHTSDVAKCSRRLMSIPHPRLRGGPLFSCEEVHP